MSLPSPMRHPREGRHSHGPLCPPLFPLLQVGPMPSSRSSFPLFRKLLAPVSLAGLPPRLGRGAAWKASSPCLSGRAATKHSREEMGQRTTVGLSKMTDIGGWKVLKISHSCFRDSPSWASPGHCPARKCVWWKELDGERRHSIESSLGSELDRGLAFGHSRTQHSLLSLHVLISESGRKGSLVG